MPITAEHLAERAAAALELGAADEARRQADARVAAAEARLDAAHATIADQMEENEVRALVPNHIPAIRKVNGRLEVGVIHSAHPTATAVPAQ